MLEQQNTCFKTGVSLKINMYRVSSLLVLHISWVSQLHIVSSKNLTKTFLCLLSSLFFSSFFFFYFSAYKTLRLIYATAVSYDVTPFQLNSKEKSWHIRVRCPTAVTFRCCSLLILLSTSPNQIRNCAIMLLLYWFCSWLIFTGSYFHIYRRKHYLIFRTIKCSRV